MKTKTGLFLALVMWVGFTSAFAGVPDETGLAVVHAQGSDIVKIVYRASDEGSVRLNVYKSNHELIYTETVKTTHGFIRPLNFSGLAKGEYTIELVDTKGTSVKKVNYKDATTAYVAIKQLSETDKYWVSVVGKNAVNKVSVRIFHGDELIYSEVKKIEGQFAEVYKVKDLRRNLTIQVIDENGEVIERVF